MIVIKHILITAGGTVEPIDAVRQIHNTSSGSLCASIYTALAEHLAQEARRGGTSPCGFVVHYVAPETAVRPQAENHLPLHHYPVTDVESVKATLEKLLTDFDIGYVIHGMAVSDFTKDYLIERADMIRDLSEAFETASAVERDKLTPEMLSEIFGAVLECPSSRLDASTKVSSNADLILSLKRTPKLIDIIKKRCPETFLVGFKLLVGASEAELIAAAAALSNKNGCNLVLANDMNKIHKGRHEGLLIKGTNVLGRYETKKEIARGIAKNMLGSVAHVADME